MTGPAPRAGLGVVGIGNALAGDDGAGLAVVDRLGPRVPPERHLFLHRLEGDLLAIADLLDRAERFVFVDAMLGIPPGEVRRLGRTDRAPPAPSLHQLDLTEVLHRLEVLRIADPFPDWEVWGVGVAPPFALGAGLSPDVDRAVNRTVDLLLERLAEVEAAGGGTP